MRAFVALDLDSTFLDHVAALAERLRGDGRLGAARFVKRETMHVTLRFLGSIDEAAAAVFAAFVGERARSGTIALEATGLLAFPDPRRARVLTIGLAETTGRLDELAAACDEVARAVGLEARDLALRPHLTLARTPGPRDVRSLAAESTFRESGIATSLALYRSDTRADGPVYTALARADLATR